jgi:hypothetical protein
MAATFRYVNGEPVPVRAHELARGITDDGAAIRVRTIELTVAETIATLVRVEMRTDPAVSSAEAQARVFAKHPALYRAHVSEATVGRDGGRVTLTGAVPPQPPSARQRAAGLTPISFPTAKATPTIEKQKATSSGGETYDAALAIIAEKTTEIMQATGCREADALTRALRENPSLYPAYVAAFRRRADGVEPIGED